MVVPFFSVYFVRELGASEAWYGTLRVVERTIEVVAMLGVAPVAARLGPVATIAWTQALSVPMLLSLGFAPGGFFGHCSRQDEQEWTITSDTEGRVIRIRLNKRGQWKDKWGNSSGLADKPRKFHDYNF